MADEVHRPYGLYLAQQKIEVGDVVREPVAVRLSPFGEPVTAPVGGVHVPVLHELVHDELNDADTSIQPCESSMIFGAPGAGQRRTW